MNLEVCRCAQRRTVKNRKLFFDNFTKGYKSYFLENKILRSSSFLLANSWMVLQHIKNKEDIIHEKKKRRQTVF